MNGDPDAGKDGDQTTPDDVPYSSTMTNSIAVLGAIGEDAGRRGNEEIRDALRDVQGN